MKILSSATVSFGKALRPWMPAIAAGMVASHAAPEPTPTSEDRPPNVLIFFIDDLRPDVGCYGRTEVKTPEIDRLASSGVLFERAYCQQAICAPSRASFLTGKNPDVLGILDLGHPVSKTLPDTVTMPAFFKKNGFTTVAAGKIYHHGDDDKASWTEQFPLSKTEYALPETLKSIEKRVAEVEAQQLTGVARSNALRGPATEMADVDDSAYTDGQVADWTVGELQKLAKDGQPFFFCVGFSKPHLPFAAPKKYWDLYDRSTLTLPERDRPDGAPEIAFTEWGELRAYTDIPKEGDLDEEKTLELIHGYRAATSYMDAQVGKVLDALDETGLSKNTIVILWGDHGYKLGEYGDWSKHTNFELDNHVPLIIRLPEEPSSAGKRTAALTEMRDIFPTVAALTGLEPPPGLEGENLGPVLADPDSTSTKRKIALSIYPRARKHAQMGYSARDDRWRYTEWVDRASGDVFARELYDHSSSPVAETNLAEDPAHRETVERLSAALEPHKARTPKFVAPTPSPTP